MEWTSMMIMKATIKRSREDLESSGLDSKQSDNFNLHSRHNSSKYYISNRSTI